MAGGRSCSRNCPPLPAASRVLTLNKIFPPCSLSQCRLFPGEFCHQHVQVLANTGQENSVSINDRWGDESVWGDYTKDIVIMPRRQQQIVAAQRPGGKWWPRQSAECYQQSLRLLHPVISPESWTKLRTIYDQNENNKGDLQQWLHPKWSMWWWNYVDTELCILFLTFSIVSALRGPAMGWGLLLLCYSTLPQDSHPLCRSHGALSSSPGARGQLIMELWRRISARDIFPKMS